MWHECSNHIQHEGEARGLYVVTHKCIIPYSTCRGVLTGSSLYPTYMYDVDQSYHQGNMLDIALWAISRYCPVVQIYDIIIGARPSGQTQTPKLAVCFRTLPMTCYKWGRSQNCWSLACPLASDLMSTPCVPSVYVWRCTRDFVYQALLLFSEQHWKAGNGPGDEAR